MPPRPPPILVVTCFRSEERQSAFLDLILASQLIRDNATVREIPLAELMPRPFGSVAW